MLAQGLDSLIVVRQHRDIVVPENGGFLAYSGTELHYIRVDKHAAGRRITRTSRMACGPLCRADPKTDWGTAPNDALTRHGLAVLETFGSRCETPISCDEY